MKYICVDIGSSFVKTALVDTEKLLIEKKSVLPALPRLRPTPLSFEVDINGLEKLVLGAINGYIDGESELSGILLSTQMHGFVVAGADKNPLTNYVSWQDTRCLEKLPSGKTAFEELSALVSREDMKNSGNFLKPMMGMCNLYAMVKGGLKLPSGARFCTLGSYLIMRMTGQNLCHITNAAPTGFADALNNTWNLPLIEKTGFSALEFPALTAGLEPAGEYVRGGRSLPVYPDFGDHQLSILGSLSRPGRDFNISMGTAGLAGLVSDGFVRGAYESRPFFEGKYLNSLSGLPAGRNMDVLIEFARDTVRMVTGTEPPVRDVWKHLEDVMGEDTGGLETGTMFFAAAPEDRGYISGISTSNLTLRKIFKSAFYDIAKHFMAAMDKICPDKSALERIVFSGGFAMKTPELVGVVSKAAGLQAVFPPCKDEVFVGLMRLALIISGKRKNLAATEDIRPRVVE